MMMLILGKNGSGKSLYAENAACRLSDGALYYIATMIPYGSEGANRIERHRAQRSGKGFITIEAPYGEATGISGTVLLEDVSNLAANLMFDKKLPSPEDQAVERISRLNSVSANLIAVSISGLDGQGCSDEDTLSYIRLMNNVNRRLELMADVVIEMASGIATIKKGGSLWPY